MRLLFALSVFVSAWSVTVLAAQLGHMAGVSPFA